MGNSKQTNSILKTTDGEDTRRAASFVERADENSTPKTILPPWWWILLFLLLGHQLIQYGLGWSLPLIDNYLDPLLSMPLLLQVITVERGFLFNQERLSRLEIVVITITLAILFEEIFPLLKPAFVRDWWDYLMYVIGAICFTVLKWNSRSPSGD